MEFEEGQILIIENERLEIVKLLEDYDIPAGGGLGREHLFFELHKIGEESLMPTHIAKIYFDKPTEMQIFESRKTRTPDLKNLKVGEVIKWNFNDWINKKTILLKDLKIEN